MKKLLKVKTLAFCAILLTGIIFPATLTAQRSDGFFKADNEEIYTNRGNITENGNMTLGGFENEDPTPVGNGLLLLTIAGAGYAIARRKRSLRNGITLLLAFTLLLSLTQCKKKTVTPSNTNSDSIYITLNASYGGDRTVFDPTVSNPNNAFTWTPNVREYIYVGGSFHSGLMGTLSGITSSSDAHTISFSGTINDIYDNEELYFFYIGEGIRRYDYPSQVVCFADQTGNLSDVTDFHIAIGSATHHSIAGETTYSYNANLDMAMAIAYFDLNNFGNEEVRIYGDDLYTIAEVDYQHGRIVGKAKGSIKTKNVSGGNYIALIPSTTNHTVVRFVSDSHVGELNFNRGIQAKKYYSSDGELLVVQADSYTVGTDGLLSGDFTVSSSGKKVHFSQGNLQYKGSESKPYWKFAETQLDSIVGQDCDDENVDRDLFGWATSGYHRNIDSVNCRNFPFTTTTASAVYRGHGNNNYPGYGPTRFKTGDGSSGAFPNNSIEIKPLDLVQESADYDWGIHNAISNGGNMPNKWRLLTDTEWNYILNTRQTLITIGGKEARYTLATIVLSDNSKVRGLILFPDSEEVTGSINDIQGIEWGTINGGSLFTTSCTEDAWNTLQDAGCVFLRAAGYRNNTTMSYERWAGFYWSSVSAGPNIAKCMFLGYLGAGNPGIAYKYSVNRSYGCSVRLVRDVN